MKHRCRRGKQCPDSEQLSGITVGRAINPEDGLCETCTRQALDAVAELPADYARLHNLLPKAAGPAGDQVSGTREPPAPLALHVEAFQRELVYEAVCWARSTAWVAGETWEPGGRPGAQLARACDLLRRRPSAWLALREEVHAVWLDDDLQFIERDGLDGALKLLSLHQRARRYTGQVAHVIHLPMPCPACEEMSLQRKDGADVVDCAACHRQLTWEQYQQRCLALTDGGEAVG